MTAARRFHVCLVSARRTMVTVPDYLCAAYERVSQREAGPYVERVCLSSAAPDDGLAEYVASSMVQEIIRCA